MMHRFGGASSGSHKQTDKGENMIYVNYDRAVELIKAQVDKKPKGYRYSFPDSVGRCYNVYPNAMGEKTPSCIVGHVYVDLGVDAETIWREVPQHGVAYACDKLGIEITQKTEDFLDRCQSYQDDGETWEYSFNAAKGFVEDSNFGEYDESENRIYRGSPFDV